MPKRTRADLSPADRMRYQLLRCGLTQTEGARALGIDVRTMRKYCSGKHHVPRVIDMAMQYLVVTTKYRPRLHCKASPRQDVGEAALMG